MAEAAEKLQITVPLEAAFPFAGSVEGQYLAFKANRLKYLKAYLLVIVPLVFTNLWKAILVDQSWIVAFLNVLYVAVHSMNPIALAFQDRHYVAVERIYVITSLLKALNVMLCSQFPATFAWLVQRNQSIILNVLVTSVNSLLFQVTIPMSLVWRIGCMAIYILGGTQWPLLLTCISVNAAALILCCYLEWLHRCAFFRKHPAISLAGLQPLPLYARLLLSTYNSLLPPVKASLSKLVAASRAPVAIAQLQVTGDRAAAAAAAAAAKTHSLSTSLNTPPRPMNLRMPSYASDPEMQDAIVAQSLDSSFLQPGNEYLSESMFNTWSSTQSCLSVTSPSSTSPNLISHLSFCHSENPLFEKDLMLMKRSADSLMEKHFMLFDAVDNDPLHTTHVHVTVPWLNLGDMPENGIQNLEERLRESWPEARLLKHAVRQGSLLVALEVITLGFVRPVATSTCILAPKKLPSPKDWFNWLLLPWPKDGGSVFVQVGDMVHAISWDSDASTWVEADIFKPLSDMVSIQNTALQRVSPLVHMHRSGGVGGTSQTDSMLWLDIAAPWEHDDKDICLKARCQGRAVAVQLKAEDTELELLPCGSTSLVFTHRVGLSLAGLDEAAQHGACHITLEVWRGRLIVQSVPILVLPSHMAAVAQELQASPHRKLREQAQLLNLISSLGSWFEFVARPLSDGQLASHMVAMGSFLLNKLVVNNMPQTASEILHGLVQVCGPELKLPLAEGSNPSGFSLLSSAVMSKRPSMVALVEGWTKTYPALGSWFSEDANGVTPLHLAAINHASHLISMVLFSSRRAMRAWKMARGQLSCTPEECARAYGLRLVQLNRRRSELEAIMSGGSRSSSAGCKRTSKYTAPSPSRLCTASFPTPQSKLLLHTAHPLSIITEDAAGGSQASEPYRRELLNKLGRIGSGEVDEEGDLRSSIGLSKPENRSCTGEENPELEGKMKSWSTMLAKRRNNAEGATYLSD